MYLVSFATLVVGYISTFFIARHIASTGAGLALFGFVQFNLLLATSVNSLGELRLGSAFVYFVARDRTSIRATGTYFVSRFAFVALFGASLLALAPTLGIVSTSGGLTVSSPSLLLCLGVFMVLPLLWTPGAVYGQLYVGLGNSIRAQLPTLVESVVRTTALVVVALSLPSVNGIVNPDAIWGLTLGYVLGAAASAGVSLPSVWYYFAPPRLSELRRLLSYSWPLLGSLGLLYLVTNAMPLLARAFYDTAAVALLNAANSFRTLLLLMPSAVVVPLFPHLAGLHGRQELAALGSRVWYALRYTAMLVVPGSLLFLVYRSNLLLILYQKSYLGALPGAGGAAEPLGILALSAIPLALSQVIGTTLFAIGSQRLELYITSLQVAILIGGSLALIHLGATWGILGLTAIALAALASSVGALALNAYFLRAGTPVPYSWRPAWSLVLAGAIEVLVAMELNSTFGVGPGLPVDRWYDLLAIGLPALVAYVGTLMLTGEMSRKDLRTFAGALGIPSSWANRLARLCWRESPE